MINKNVVFLYVVIGLLVFGHAAANTTDCDRNKIAQECRAVKGIFSGMFWPLYLSWVTFDRVNGKEPDQ